MIGAIQPHNAKASATWDSAGELYDDISRTIADSIEHAIARLAARPGERILDLCCGTGWASRSLGEAVPGLRLVGLDLGPELVATARERARRRGLEIEYMVGDAESLPFADGEMDAVLSTCGVMFAGRQEAAAAELARVVRPGGRVVLTTWRPDSTLFELFLVMRRYMPAPPSPAPRSPFEWGKEERVRELLGDAFELQFEEGISTYRGPSPAAAWTLWSAHYGPLRSLAQNLEPERRAELERDVVTFFERFQTPVGVAQPRTYLVTIGRRT